MKKGTVVTEQNLTMIFGRVKSALKDSNILYSRVVYNSQRGRAFKYLNMKSRTGFVSINGNVVMTLKSGIRFSQNDICIKERADGFKYIFVAGKEININDRVCLTSREILIFKMNKFVCVECCTKSHYTEVWQFN